MFTPRPSEADSPSVARVTARVLQVVIAAPARPLRRMASVSSPLSAASQWTQQAQAQVAASQCVQRIWRGVCARRLFSDLFFEAAEAHFGTGVATEVAIFGDEPPRVAREISKPSLEEAHAEAEIKYNHHMVSSHSDPESQPGSPAAPSSAQGRWEAVSATMLSPTGALPTRWGATLAATGALPSADASASPLRPSVFWGDQKSSSAQHARTLSSGGRAGGHRRQPSEGGMQTAAAIAAASAEDDGAASLEFTAEMAEHMSVAALRELKGVLTRLIATRNKDLVGLLERRDELTHERDFRQATVAALVAQVDRSQYVSAARKRETKRGHAS